jgi:hypothetical protein
LLESGRFAPTNELAAAEKLDRSNLGRLLQLALLAPDIVEAIVEGRQAQGVALPRLMEPLPTAWELQRTRLALPEHDDSKWTAVSH